MIDDFSVVVSNLQRRVGVSTGKMFGATGLKVNGKIFAMQVKGRLVVKLAPTRATELCTAGVAVSFDPGHGRKMKQWISVAAGTDQDWLELSKEALAYARG